MERVGKYEILEKLGQGGMGVVYKALDPLIERVVALKTISTQLDAEPEFRARFFREGRSAGKLSHKNIITIYDLGEDNNIAYLAMEFLDGEDLKSMILRKAPMSLGRKISLMYEICEGLAHAHGHNVIHRDIKPANIFVTRSGQVKILDFGLARAVTSDLTKSGLTMGTPNYMSPQQVRGEPVDHRTDIFSAGVVFYELLTYCKPFDGDSFASTIYKILELQPEPPEQLDARIPPGLSAIVMKALAKNPDERYGSSTSMQQDLMDFARTHADEIERSGTIFVEPVPARGGRPEDRGTKAAQKEASGGEVPVHEMETGQLPRSSVDSVPPGAGRTRMVVPQPVEAEGAKTADASRKRRLTLGLAAAAVVLAVSSVAVWLTFRGQGGADPDSTFVEPPAAAEEAPAPPPAIPESPAPAENPAIVAGLGRGRDALQKGRFDDAVREADAVLQQDPSNAGARELRSRAGASRDQVARDTARARELYASGRYQEASAAIGEVLRTAPSHGEARQLATQLNQYARKSADDALAQMREAKSAAEAALAVELAPRSWSAARAMEVEAVRLHGEKRYGDAAARLFEVSGLYRSAEMEALAEKEARAERSRRAEQERQRLLLQTQAEAAKQSYERDRARALESGADARAADRFREAQRQASEAQSRMDRGDLAGARQGFEAAASTMLAARDAAVDAARQESLRATESARRVEAESRPKPPEDVRAAAAAVIGRYKSALESRSMSALKSVWPGLSGEKERAIREDFGNAREIRVVFDNLEYELREDYARVTGIRRYQVQTIDGHRLQRDSKTTFQIRKNGGNWQIEDVGFEPIQ